MRKIFGILLPQKIVTENDTKRGLSALVYDAVYAQSMGVLTTGAFLVAFAVYLGASNLVIGLIAAIGPLCQVLQIPSIYIVDRLSFRKLINVTSIFTARFLWIPIAILPWVMKPSSALTALLVLLFIYNILCALGGCAWNSWIRKFIPEEAYSTLFPKRMAFGMGVGAVLSMLAGLVVEKLKYSGMMPSTPYSICFIAGAIFGLIGMCYILKIPEAKTEPKTEDGNFFRSLLMPIRDKRYINLLKFLGTWNFAINMAAPFFIVYMMKYLSIDIFTIIVFSVLNQLVTFLFFGIWGRLSDRFSNKSCLSVSGCLYVISIALWTFTEKNSIMIPMILLIHILTGISTAGVSLCSNNITLKFAPKDEATSYLAVTSLVNGVVTAIAPIIAGYSEIFFQDYQINIGVTCRHLANTLKFTFLDYQGLDFVFLIAFILGAYALHRLIFVKEEGEINEKYVYTELVMEIYQGVKNVSNVMGLGYLVGGNKKSTTPSPVEEVIPAKE